MTVQVEMPAKYLSLPLLAEAIVKAEVAASGTDFDVPNTKPRLSERVGEWRKRLLNLGTRGLIDAYEFNGFGLKKWADFKVDHDVLCVDNLNDCLYLKDQGLEFVVARDERGNREFAIGFAEASLNGNAISWRYWVEQMPVLGAKEASRLLCGLDPDCYTELKQYLEAKVDASEHCRRAMKMERLATAAGKTSDTAAGWLQWAKQHRFVVHDGFILALEDKSFHQKLAAELESLPYSESRIWDESPLADDDKRLVTFSFAGNLSAQNMSLQEFLGDVSERMERWKHGRFLLVEAAQVLASANKKIEVMSLLAQMEAAIVDGSLAIRRNGIPLAGRELERGRFWNRTIAQDDVNSWLASVKGGYRLADPYRPVVKYTHLRNSKLTAVTQWRHGFLGELDALTLEDASRLASLHAKSQVTVTDFLRAAANELITLKAVMPREVKVYRFDGKPFCNAGRADEDRISKGVLMTLPISACWQLAATARASWREFDDYATIDEEVMRYVKGELLKEEANIETDLAGCRVMGHSVHALADLYLHLAGEAEGAPSAELPNPEVLNSADQVQAFASSNSQPAASDASVVTSPQAPATPQGLPTKVIADCFDNVKFSAPNWRNRLSSGTWADSARLSRGVRGGPSSMWNPLMLAQKVIEREPKIEQEKRMKEFNSRFNQHAELGPWKDGWKEYVHLFFYEE